MDRIGRILMVEDDSRDVELTLTALEEYNLANEVVVVGDGEEALDYLYHERTLQHARAGKPRRHPARPEAAEGRRAGGPWRRSRPTRTEE